MMDRFRDEFFPQITFLKGRVVALAYLANLASAGVDGGAAGSLGLPWSRAHRASS
jgi:hypothetical protein